MLKYKYFPTTKFFVENYMQIPTPGKVPKYWIKFSYIGLEDYELDLNFNETEMNMKWYH